MGKYWDYAQLSQLAKSAGGPQAFVKAIKHAGYMKGSSAALLKGRWQGILAGVAGTIALEAILYTLYFYLAKRNKRKSDVLEAEQDSKIAEDILISELEKFGNENTAEIVEALKNDGIDIDEDDIDYENSKEEEATLQSSDDQNHDYTDDPS